MELLPVFADAFGYTPDEYRAISLGDRVHMAKYLADKHERSR